jgi:hypothetical protein
MIAIYISGLEPFSGLVKSRSVQKNLRGFHEISKTALPKLNSVPPPFVFVDWDFRSFSNRLELPRPGGFKSK